jgi:hypothetical protein
MPNPPAYTPDELSAFIKAVQDTRPLNIADPADEARYVRHLQGPKNALGRLKSEITHQEGDGVYLFTGQIGSGKSTELLRLKKELESPQCKVYYCDLGDWLNLSAPIDLVSMLLGLVASWIEAVGVAGRAKRTPIERLTDFLTRTNINLDNIKLESSMAAAKAQIQLALKTDETFRARLEQTLKNNVTGFVSQARSFVSELVADICAHGEKCVVIADSLEKIRGYGEESEKVYQSVERLFLSEGDALRLPTVHVVYSVSPFLLAQNPHLPGILGQGVVVNMPSVHIFKKRSTDLDPDGVKQMTSLLELRYPGWEKFFSRDFLQRLIHDCGGDLRDYLRAIKVVLLEMEAEPDAAEDDLLSAARSQISPPRLIPTNDIAWMARLERSHDPELDEKVTSVAFQRYLATKHILAYLNGDAWYAIHPLLREWVMARPEAQAQGAQAGT